LNNKRHQMSPGVWKEGGAVGGKTEKCAKGGKTRASGDIEGRLRRPGQSSDKKVYSWQRRREGERDGKPRKGRASSRKRRVQNKESRTKRQNYEKHVGPLALQ